MSYSAPGVYVEEVPSGPQPIAAASTSVVALLGTTRRGPYLTPTRVSSWSDFVRTFGTATHRSVSAESVFGFFENGGPAAWIVRVDPSTRASWRVCDQAGAESFVVSASSRGTWANGLTIGLRPDTSGASGTPYRAGTTGTAVALTAGTPATVAVTTTAGLRPDDAVSLVPLPSSDAPLGATAGRVVSVADGTVEIDAAADVTLPPGSVIAGALPGTADTLHLPAGNGFRPGDVVVVTAPHGALVSGHVAAVDKSGTAVTLALHAPLGTTVPGAALVQRRAALAATVTPVGSPAPGTPPVSAVPLSQLTFASAATAPLATELGAAAPGRAAATLTVDGRSGPWVAGSSRFEIVGSAPLVAGPATVEAAVGAVLLADTGLALEQFTVDDVRAGYELLPDGAEMAFTGAGVPEVRLARTGDTFTLTPTPAAGDVYTTATFVPPATVGPPLLIRCAVAPRAGEYLDLDGAPERIAEVTLLGGDTYAVTFAPASGSPAWPDPAQTRFRLLAVVTAAVSAHRFTLTIDADGTRAEEHAGLALDPAHPMYFARDGVVNGVSDLVTVAPRPAGAADPSLVTTPAWAEVVDRGADRPATSTTFAEGLTALEAVPEPAILIAPDTVLEEDPLLMADRVGRLVTHAERFRRFAVVDAPDSGDDGGAELVAWRSTNVSSTSAAVFAPHVRIVAIDPDSVERFRDVPPSGFVAGVMARTDRTRGVHKAPGNEQVHGIVGLTHTFTQRHQELLNPASVNLMRAFPGRGTRVWGARNATDDITWRYVNVRRLFLMIETSVDTSTQWVVFEPNTPSTWIRVKTSVENFLEQQWRAGALAGTRPEEAYRVRVGLGETMTETDVDLGLIITEVAIAPAKPAEFVVFRFSHKRLSD